MVEPNTDRIVPRRRALLLAGVGLVLRPVAVEIRQLSRNPAVPVLLQRHLRTAVVLLLLLRARPLIPLTRIFQKGTLVGEKLQMVSIMRLICKDLLKMFPSL